jgi:hypothetical protein
VVGVADDAQVAHALGIPVRMALMSQDQDQ